jgi:hypothetical protein
MFSPELYQLCTLWNNQIEHIGMRKKMFTSEIMCLRGKKNQAFCMYKFVHNVSRNLGFPARVFMESCHIS